MPKKKGTPQSEAEADLLRKEKRDLNIRLGFDAKEFFSAFAGSYLHQAWEQQIAVSMKDGYIGKHPKGHPKQGEYLVQDFADYATVRGFILGIEWVLDDIQGRMNKATRLDRERRKEEKEKAET